MTLRWDFLCWGIERVTYKIFRSTVYHNYSAGQKNSAFKYLIQFSQFFKINYTMLISIHRSTICENLR